MDQDPNMAPRSPALERGLALIEVIAQRPNAVSCGDLHRVSSAPKSSLIRLLSVLRRGGWIDKDEDGYIPGQRLAALRAPVNRTQQLRAAAVPLLENLRTETGNTAICF